MKSSNLPVVSFISNFISYRVLFLHQMEIGRDGLDVTSCRKSHLKKILSLFKCYKKKVKDTNLDPKESINFDRYLNLLWLLRKGIGFA